VLRAVTHDPQLLGHVTVRRKGFAHSGAGYVVPERVSRDDQVGSDVMLLQVRVPLTAVALLDLVVPSEAIQGLLRDVHASTKFNPNYRRERARGTLSPALRVSLGSARLYATSTEAKGTEGRVGGNLSPSILRADLKRDSRRLINRRPEIACTHPGIPPLSM